MRSQSVEYAEYQGHCYCSSFSNAKGVALRMAMLVCWFDPLLWSRLKMNCNDFGDVYLKGHHEVCICGFVDGLPFKFGTDIPVPLRISSNHFPSSATTRPSFLNCSILWFMTNTCKTNGILISLSFILCLELISTL